DTRAGAAARRVFGGAGAARHCHRSAEVARRPARNGGMSAVASESPLQWQRVTGPPRVIAHRGASRAALETPLAAFRAARNAGGPGVELDVMRCRSGDVVVFHDDDLKRLFGRSERVDALSLSALRQHDIPTLEEALEEIGSRLLVNVELKTDRRRGDP